MNITRENLVRIAKETAVKTAPLGSRVGGSLSDRVFAHR